VNATKADSDSFAGLREMRRQIQAMISDDPAYRRLLPRHGVMLFAPNDGGERFTRLFRETWGRIPLGVRRRILAYWREPPAIVWVRFPIAPVIELIPHWSERETGRGLRGDMANVTGGGYVMHFWTKIVAVFPDDLVRDLIAHELAHVHQWSIGWNLATEDPYGIEEDADITAEAWGFSASNIDDWCREHGVIKTIDLDKVSDSTRRRYLKKSLRSGR
jgi:hypothetical protein